MATVPEQSPPSARPELHSGDRMTREEFHRIYVNTPADFKAELIGGIVYVASPLKLPHGTNHLPLGSLFFLYETETPGVQSGDNTTLLLGVESEPQPDLFLRVLPECGGQSRTTADEYIEGPPELVAEVAHSSRAIDLHAKRADYARHGVLDYLVLCVQEKQLRRFDLQADRELPPDDDGVVRPGTFPGLWVHAEALLARDHKTLLETFRAGLASAAHADFVRRLADARQG